MAKKKSKLEIAQEQAENSINEANQKIEELGKHTSDLYVSLNSIQEVFDRIRNVPSEKRLEYENLKKIRLEWKREAEKIESDYKKAAIKNVGNGAAGVAAGVGVAALGPTAAMGIATTFGVASTGTAISALSGAAATNAALAWLGGGALAAGGGGMAAGNALLALAGPVGWAIAGVAILGSGFLFWKAQEDKSRLENIFTLISKRDVKKYELARVELNERIVHIVKEEELLNEAIAKILTFGLDYNEMTEEQQYELGAYVNLMNASTQLLVNPIMGLQPRYSEQDLQKFVEETNQMVDEQYKDIVIALANLLYKIELDEKDKKILFKSLKKNKEMLESMNITKKEFDISLLEIVEEMLEYRYSY